MSTRLPQSLSWLINKRARVAGEIQKLEREHPALTETNRRIVSGLTRDLEALDNTFRLHDIKVNPREIKPIKPQRGKRLFPHTHLTKAIYVALSEANGEPLGTQELAYRVFLQLQNPNVSEVEFEWLKTSLKNRLQKLCGNNSVQRHHDKRTSEESLWSLPRSLNYALTLSEAPVPGGDSGSTRATTSSGDA